MKSAKTYIRYTLSFVIMALFMYLAFRGQDFNAIGISLRRVHFVWIFYLIVGGVLSHIVRAWRWQYLLVPIKEQRHASEFFFRCDDRVHGEQFFAEGR